MSATTISRRRRQDADRHPQDPRPGQRHSHDGHTQDGHTHDGHSHDGHSHDGEPGAHTHSLQPVERPPTGQAVVFDIGDGVGALIVRLDDALAGTEIPIDALDDPSLHVHTGVWRRMIGSEHVVVAVYPELPEGRYRFPATDDHQGASVTIVSGQIAKLDLRRQRES